MIHCAKPPEEACKPRLKDARDPALDRTLASNIVSRSCHSHTGVEDGSVFNTVWLAADLRIRPNLVWWTCRLAFNCASSESGYPTFRIISPLEIVYGSQDEDI